MTSPADDVAALITTNNLHTGWGLFVGEEGATPDNAITVYDTPGGTMGNPDGQMYDPNIQVRIRSHSYASAYAKGAAIRDLLVLPTSRTVGQWFYTGFWLISDLAKIGKDANNRHLFTVNLRLMREPASP